MNLPLIWNVDKLRLAQKSRHMGVHKAEAQCFSKFGPSPTRPIALNVSRPVIIPLHSIIREVYNKNRIW